MNIPWRVVLMARCKNPDCRKKFDNSGQFNSFDNWCCEDCRKVVLSLRFKKRNGPTTSSLKRGGQLKTKNALKGMALGSKEQVSAKKEKKKKLIDKGTFIQPHKLNGLTLEAAEAKAVTVCHRYIRERDRGELCICCNRHLGENYHAGHYMESGSNSSTRFDEDNIHAQRIDCNIIYNGDYGDYGPNLRAKIGDEKVDRLISKSKSKEVVKRTIEDYLEIIDYYEKKLLKLSSRNFTGLSKGSYLDKMGELSSSPINS